MRVHGEFDAYLSTQGNGQLEFLEKRFRDVEIDRVYSSHLTRAKRTAEAIAYPKGLKIYVDRELRECAAGANEDRLYGPFEKWKEMPDKFEKNPTAERPEKSAERMETAILRIARENDGKKVAIVSHAAAIMHFLKATVKDIEFDGFYRNTAVTKITVENGDINLIYCADCSHNENLIVREEENGKRWRESLHIDKRKPKFPKDSKWIIGCWKDAWQKVYGTLCDFDEKTTLWGVKRMALFDHEAVTVFTYDDKPFALLQLDINQAKRDNAGHIAFIYISPEYRNKNIGNIIMGQAVYTYRRIGREYLRLRVNKNNAPALAFYKKFGFYQMGIDGDDLMLRFDINAVPFKCEFEEI